MPLPDRFLPRLLFDIPVRPRPFDFSPAAPAWVVLVGGILATIAIVYLYSAQQKIASRAVIRTLTAIRILLLVLVVAMLLGPVYQQTHTTHSSGTLWVLVDQSMSMRQKDPQSTRLEQLRWADALGLLPADLRPNRLPVLVRQLSALRDDVKHFESEARRLGGAALERRPREALADELTTWTTKLTGVADAFDHDADVKASAGELPSELRGAAASVSQSISSLAVEQRAAAPWRWPKVVAASIALIAAGWLYAARRRLQSPALVRLVPAFCTALLLVAVGLGAWVANQWKDGDAALALASRQPIRVVRDSADLPWQALHDSLSKAIARLTPIADSVEQRFLDEHESDPRILEAVGKVKQLSRGDLAYAALTGSPTRGLKALAQAMGRQEVKIVPIGTPSDVRSPGTGGRLINPEKSELGPTLQTLLKDPRGPNTDISGALQFASGQVGENATVLVVSDGRQNIGAAPEEPAHFLASKGVRVLTLLVGSRQIARDAAVERVDAPDWVYKDDDVVVTPIIRLDGLKDREVTVEFLRGNELVATRKVTAHTEQYKAPLRFTDRPPEGVHDFTVKIVPMADEAVLDNNSQSVRVAVKNDKIKVLIVEDQPRWEYQFLRNYLVRDKRVNLQVVLVDPAHVEDIQSPEGLKASADNNREGANVQRVDAQLLPSTKQEWSAFDIIVLGDVPPEKVPAEQQQNLSAAIRDGGKGLLIIAGARNMPMRFAGTPLADLLPVDLSAGRWTPQELHDHLRRGFSPRQAPDGLESILGQFSEDPGINAELWGSVGPWFWHSEQTVVRPGAGVIWAIQELDAGSSESRQPPRPDRPEEIDAVRQRALLATMNVGLGRVMYLASPQTWRLRYVQTRGVDSRAEDLHRRFWGQVIRWAAASDLPAGNKDIRFGTNKRTYIGGEQIVVTARITKADAMQGQSFKVVASTGDGTEAGEAAMVEAPAEGPGVYRGALTLSAGSYALALRGGQPDEMLKGESSGQKTLQIEVQSNSTIEDRNVNTDPQLMESIARAGDGIALDGAYFDVLGDHVPVIDRTETIVSQAGLFSSPNDPRTWWAHWIFFGTFVVLLTAEWILRKRGGLV